MSLITKTSLFGKKYALRYCHTWGGSDPMFTIRLQDCPRVGDFIQTARDFMQSLQWRVVEVEHLEGNMAVIHVVDRFDRDLWRETREAEEETIKQMREEKGW